MARAQRANLALEAHDQIQQERQADIAARVIKMAGEEFDVPSPATAALAALTSRREALEALAVAYQACELAQATSDILDMDAATARLLHDEAEARAAEALAQAERQAGRLAALRAMATGVGDAARDLARALVDRTDAMNAAATVTSLSDVVSAARGSANYRRLKLESFAIQQRFRSVLQAASIHLDRMSAGKYELVLEDEARRNQQSGLGIAVIDAWTGARRDPRTLSGGETFYVSLALALGLADVVRDESGGIPMETLFVDEGFGSLDQDTLELVLEQLDHLRSGGRVIGVVSHVTEMKEWVNDRIAVAIGPDRTSHAQVRR